MNIATHMGVAPPAGMVSIEDYFGLIEDYDGGCGVLYTEQELSKNEYYYLKYLLLRKRVELIHPCWDDDDLNDFVVYLNQRESSRRGGRLAYGFIRRNGVVVEDAVKIELARQIIELRDSGLTYRGIRDEIGGVLSVGTVSNICMNRERYKKKTGEKE